MWCLPRLLADFHQSLPPVCHPSTRSIRRSLRSKERMKTLEISIERARSLLSAPPPLLVALYFIYCPVDSRAVPTIPHFAMHAPSLMISLGCTPLPPSCASSCFAIERSFNNEKSIQKVITRFKTKSSCKCVSSKARGTGAKGERASERMQEYKVKRNELQRRPGLRQEACRPSTD